MDEKQILDKIQNVLIDHNLRQPRDYVITSYNKGCCLITLCPHRYAILDIQYFYDMIPDIKVFRIKQKRDVVEINIKVKMR